MRIKKLVAALGSALTLCLATGIARADVIPYSNAGHYNTTTYSFTAATDGEIIAYIVGGFSAAYVNEIGLLINGSLSAAGFGLNNHTSTLGDSFSLGSVHAGDSLVFVLHDLSLGQDAYSDPTRNASYDAAGVTGHNHIYSTAYTATSPLLDGVPAGTYVAFEDLPFPGADYNYDDESFVFSNVETHPDLPEPGSLVLVGAALTGLGLLRRGKAA
ncbi:PEP-CTERM sorting domain-containing protein [Niveibacterium terrae]|uniref:PEP-CTERM sorting domain-containing protein n=1 Tax=Niveibacterium terrae TaxID=3373598 RepID=UPI003A9403A5